MCSDEVPPKEKKEILDQTEFERDGEPVSAAERKQIMSFISQEYIDWCVEINKQSAVVTAPVVIWDPKTDKRY